MDCPYSPHGFHVWMDVDYALTVCLACEAERTSRKVEDVEVTGGYL